MSVFKSVLRWIGGKALLYASLVLAILAGAYVAPRLKSEWAEPDLHLARAARLETVTTSLEAAGRGAERDLLDTAAAAQRKSVAELNAAIIRAAAARAEAVSHRRSGRAKAISLARADTDALLKDGQLEIEIQALDVEIAGLRAAREKMAWLELVNTLPADLEARLAKQEAAAERAMSSCQSARRNLADFEGRWEVQASFHTYQRGRRLALQRAVRESCTTAAAAFGEQKKTADMLKRRADALRAYRQSKGWTDRRIAGVTGDLAGRIAVERAAAEGSLRQKFGLWADRVHLETVLKQAAMAMALIIASPFLIRLFCYFVLAPAAMRRPGIRLPVTEGAGAIIPPAARSTTSVGVRLAAGEELLVRQGYLQTTSEAGGKGTQWLLDWRHPITSLATGLTFLTRVRGDGETTTVSAVRDPFAEVTLLTLPEGAACVLQPRALAAVVQPVRRRLRVTGHWRLFSLNAWLTLQLRYLVFHGPARLVLLGGRGVRVERAERGRVLEQNQVVGFSTNLAYSVTRTETFWPYFLGREALLKDRVAAGEGVLIVEEAPLAGRRAGEVRHGIEGMIDAGMKVFGW